LPGLSLCVSVRKATQVWLVRAPSYLCGRTVASPRGLHSGQVRETLLCLFCLQMSSYGSELHPQALGSLAVPYEHLTERRQKPKTSSSCSSCVALVWRQVQARHVPSAQVLRSHPPTQGLETQRLSSVKDWRPNGTQASQVHRPCRRTHSKPQCCQRPCSSQQRSRSLCGGPLCTLSIAPRQACSCE